MVMRFQNTPPAGGNAGNPWAGATVTTHRRPSLSGQPPLPSIPSNFLPAGASVVPANNSAGYTIQTAPPPSTPAPTGVPNADLLGNTNGTGEPIMPDVPDYLGQAGERFNNFQPVGLGNTPDFSNMFSHYAPMYNQIGPQIPVNDVISGQQQQQMLNSAIGANANQRQSAMRDAQANLGARGFTNESPALQATSNRLALNEALANTQARTDIPLQTARMNADHRLQAMQANLGQRNQDLQNFIGLENAQTNRISPLLSALVGLV